jgi:sulfate permease, SulP family
VGPRYLRAPGPFAEDGRRVTERSYDRAGRDRPASIPPPAARPAPPVSLGARVLPSVVAGVISATLIISFDISLAALIFAGDMARHLQAGIGVLLASTFVVGAIVALRSSYHPVIAAPQENTSVILALIAATIGRRAAPDAALPTLIAAFAITSAATGVLFLLLGSLRLGKFVRFIPYPVVGGFLAGTGFLLVQGALGVMSGLPVGVADANGLAALRGLFAGGVVMTWLPGVLFGLVLAAILRKSRHFLVLPSLLLGGIAVFYALVALVGPGVSGAMASGLLLGPFPGGGVFPPIEVSALARVDGGLLVSNAGNILACTVLAAISVLLNATGLELATERDLELERELRVTGVANALTALIGGVPGYLSLSESTLNHKVGARSRAPGLISAGLSVLALVAGMSAIAYFPKPVLGGLLVYLGVSFLVETLYDSAFRLPRAEYALVVIILVVVATVGFIEGVGVGIVVSSILFALNYARIDVVKRSIAGSGLRSKAARSLAHEATLRRLGGHVDVIQLQGYLFFGRGHQLFLRVKDRFASSSPLPARFVVLDFRHVDGIDSSAVVSFSRMRKLVEAEGAVLVLTHLPPRVAKQLVRGGCLDEDDPPLSEPCHARRFDDLDHGLEWVENELLEWAGDSGGESETLTRELERIVKHRVLVDRILGYLERFEADEGQEIYKKGEASKDLYLIESGELEAWIEMSGGQSRRLRTMGAGNVVGESGLYLDQGRSASVRATQPSVLYRLSIPALARMTREAPELAAAFHQFVARQLAERMVNTTSPAQMLFY